MTITFKAIVKNGLLQPLEPLDLAENQIVDLEIVSGKDARVNVKLKGAWAKYLKDQSLSYEEIQSVTHSAQIEAMERSVREFERGLEEGDDLEP